MKIDITDWCGLNDTDLDRFGCDIDPYHKYGMGRVIFKLDDEAADLLCSHFIVTNTNFMSTDIIALSRWVDKAQHDIATSIKAEDLAYRIDDVMSTWFPEAWVDIGEVTI